MICELVPNKIIKFEHVFLCSWVHLPFKFGIYLYGFFALKNFLKKIIKKKKKKKKKKPHMYNFGNAMWLASGEESKDMWFLKKWCIIYICTIWYLVVMYWMYSMCTFDSKIIVDGAHDFEFNLVEV
jgi:hypothetical protein